MGTVAATVHTASSVTLSTPSTPKAGLLVSLTTSGIPPSPSNSRENVSSVSFPVVLTPPRRKAGAVPMPPTQTASVIGIDDAATDAMTSPSHVTIARKSLLPDSPMPAGNQPVAEGLVEGCLPVGGKKNVKEVNLIGSSTDTRDNGFAVNGQSGNSSLSTKPGTAATAITFGAFTCDVFDPSSLVQITFGSFPLAAVAMEAPRGADVATNLLGREVGEADGNGVVTGKNWSEDVEKLSPLMFPKPAAPHDVKGGCEQLPLPHLAASHGNGYSASPAKMMSATAVPQNPPSHVDRSVPSHPGALLPVTGTSLPSKTPPNPTVPYIPRNYNRAPLRPPHALTPATVALVTPPRGPSRVAPHTFSNPDRYRPLPAIDSPNFLSTPQHPGPQIYALTPRASPHPPPSTKTPTLSPPASAALLSKETAPPVYVTPVSLNTGAGALAAPPSPTGSLASTSADSAASAGEPEQCLFCFERRADFFLLTCKHWGPCADCHKSGNIVMCRQPHCGLPVTKDSLHRVFR